jgi:hypothetical protein
MYKVGLKKQKLVSYLVLAGLLAKIWLNVPVLHRHYNESKTPNCGTRHLFLLLLRTDGRTDGADLCLTRGGRPRSTGPKPKKSEKT